MKKFIPLGPNLIIKIETGEVKTESGIIIEAEGTRACTAREEAVIEEVGVDAFSDLIYAAHKQGIDPVYPKVGDRVAIPRYEGNTVLAARDSDDKLERRVIQDTRILCIVSNS